MSITPQWKDELRARVTLSTVVMRTTKLQKAGREWKACCPFHDEKTPSFYVNDQKGFYHCFGCGAHGDVISWMTEQRGLSFIDAIKELASEAGMEVPAPDPVAAKKAEKRASLIDVTTEAQDWYVHNLRSAEGRAALAYLNRRGLKPETLREFGFGYAPESKQALATALPRFEDQMLVESGMRILTDDGTTYDRFRGRVMLPIQDARGRVIAFGGRTLDKRDGVAKYLNSPDTPLFDKGRTLYNLHRASPASRQSGRVVVVEGYMDVVALAQAGIADAVAPLGTALTEMQLEMLWRMVEKPVLCFDGDNAGQRAAERALRRAAQSLRAPNSLSFVRLPQGLDPDDFLRKHGAKRFEELLGDGAEIEDFIWSLEASKTDFAIASEKASLRQRLEEWALQFEDKTYRYELKRTLLDRYFEKVHPNRVTNGQSKYGLIDKESLARLKYFVQDGSREHLIKAIFSALARHQSLVPKYLERLAKFLPKTDEVLYALDVFLDVAESELDGMPMPQQAIDDIASWACPLPYPFLKADVSAEFVDPYINEALIILVDLPSAENEVKKAQEDFAEYGDEHHETLLKYWISRQNELRTSIGKAWREAAGVE
jgi:DNA primase